MTMTLTCPKVAPVRAGKGTSAKQLAVMSLIAKDRIGLLDDAANLIAEYGISIEESFVRKIGHKAVMYLCLAGSISQVQLLERELDSFKHTLGCDIVIDRTSRIGVEGDSVPKVLTITISAPDRTGLLKDLTRLFVAGNLTILAQRGWVTQARSSKPGLEYRQTVALLLPVGFDRADFLGNLQETVHANGGVHDYRFAFTDHFVFGLEL